MIAHLIHRNSVWGDIPLRIAGDNQGIRALLLGNPHDTLAQLAARFPHASLLEGSLHCFDSAIHQLDDPNAPEQPLAPLGTPFQDSVWQTLRKIPLGDTRTYRQIAESIGKPSASRAVAAACAANPIAILIPCHRVIRTDGGISGYRWGVETKRMLLARERTLNPCA